MDQRNLAWSDRPGEDGAAVAPRLRAADGGGRPDRTDGDAAAGDRRRGHGPDANGRSTSRPSAAAAGRSRCCGGRRRPCSIRTSRPAPRTRTARACSTSRWPAGTPTATCVPILAARSRAARTAALAEDGKSVTWKLKKGVKWHDGKPFTADDCVFTWEYARDPATAAVTIGTYKDVKVEKVDDHTVQGELREADAVLGRRLRRRAPA